MTIACGTWYGDGS